MPLPSLDPSALWPFVVPIVQGVVTYLKQEGAKTLDEKAVEKLGEKAGESAFGAGSKSLAKLRALFQNKDDKKAQKALQAVEEDPDDKDYQDKLIKETIRLAATDSAVANELKVLAQNVMIALPGSVVTTFSNAPSGVQAQHINQLIINCRRTGDAHQWFDWRRMNMPQDASVCTPCYTGRNHARKCCNACVSNPSSCSDSCLVPRVWCGALGVVRLRRS